MEVGITIQHAYEKQHPWIDLTSVGFSYVIDFSTMGQINRQTQRQRRVRRRLDLVYPMVTGALPKAQSWPASPASAASPAAPPCSCPQCVLVMSVKAAVANGGSAGPLQPPAARKHMPPSGAARLPPPPGPAAKPLDSTGTIRGPVKPIPSQAIRRQASGTPAGVTMGSPASPPGANGKTGRVALATLNRTNLQRLAIAQSRVLIASGVPTVPVKNLNGSSPVNPALAGITGILMSAAGLPVCLTRPPKLVLHPPPVSKSEIKSIPGVSNTSRKTTKKQAKKGKKTPEEVLRSICRKPAPLRGKQMRCQQGEAGFTHSFSSSLGWLFHRLQELISHAPGCVTESQPELTQGSFGKVTDCTICMERLTAPSGYKGLQPTVKPDLVGRLSRCGHIYHIYCLVAMYNNGNKDGSLQCPTCKTIYGVKTGTQPPGKMEYHLIPHSLPGHPDCKTIRIIYSIPPGIQVLPKVGETPMYKFLSSWDSVKLNRLCGGALVNRMGALVKEPPESPRIPSRIEATGRRQQSMNQEVGAHPTLDLLAPASHEHHTRNGAMNCLQGSPLGHMANGMRVLLQRRKQIMRNNEKINHMVLKLLLVAWDRRLIFAIGTSSTTGESDTVIWNEVHHKTEFGSNLTGHGYPDANYLDNVLAELAAQGISEDSTTQEKD
ncbi:E3 ubiquitin-protein ligase DTX4 [Puma concolor]|uniref:E3 ubiquitin-protein ligase n=1 Tax=Puma concolor TaxID=9696 RepID=A0A6P6I7W8_PUMCO|nr:E3 ubiquitin-protein ligase DTX4 [Puma concolor]